MTSTQSTSPLEDLGEPRWTFDCTECEIDTYGGEDIHQLMLEHVRETGHTVSMTRRQVGHLRPPPRFSEATIRRWKAYEDHRIRTVFIEDMRRVGLKEAERIRDEAFAAMADPNWLPAHAREDVA